MRLNLRYIWGILNHMKGGVNAEDNTVHRGCAEQSFTDNEAQNSEIQGKIPRNRGRNYTESAQKFFAQYNLKINPFSNSIKTQTGDKKWIG